MTVFLVSLSSGSLAWMGRSLKVAFAADLVVDRQPGRAKRTQDFIQKL